MAKSIEIEILVYTEEEIKLRDLGINDFEYTPQYERRTFWKIDYAFPNRENENETVFFVGEESFITGIKYTDFVNAINEAL